MLPIPTRESATMAASHASPSPRLFSLTLLRALADSQNHLEAAALRAESPPLRRRETAALRGGNPLSQLGRTSAFFVATLRKDYWHKGPPHCAQGTLSRTSAASQSSLPLIFVESIRTRRPPHRARRALVPSLTVGPKVHRLLRILSQGVVAVGRGASLALAQRVCPPFRHVISFH